MRAASSSMIRKVTLGALALVAMLVCAGTALADTISLTTNNLGIGATVGTVTLTQNGANDVKVTLTMNAGFSLKIQDGSDLNFNSSITPVSIILDSVSVGANTYTTGLGATLLNGRNVDGFGVFNANVSHITCGGAGSCPNGTVSVDSLVLDVTAPGLTPASLETLNSNGAEWSIHFCTASGGNCGPQTGFASNAGATPTPEPASSALLGFGVFGLLGLNLLKRNRVTNLHR